MEELIRFKHLLEYFVAHLNYVQSETTDFAGYDEYIKPLVEKNKFWSAGQGWKNHSIQNQVSAWDTYTNGKMCININASFGNYATRGTYINWDGTGLNIIAKWDKEKTLVGGLMLTNYSENEGGESQWTKTDFKYTLNDLALYKGEDVINENLTNFFNEFNRRKTTLDTKNKEKADMEKYTEFIELLKSNYNLILTGAPGTGKTYMAKQIAAHIMFQKNYESLSPEEQSQIGFVQFHPSYDYTDFVEGIRPTETGGFQLVDGVFKEFCKGAIRNESVAEDNFEEAWDNFVAILEEKEFIEIPLISKNRYIRIEFNSTDNSLSGFTTDSQTPKYFNRDQLYNVYKGLKGVPQGGHDNYRRAIIQFFKDSNQIGLKEYKKVDKDPNQKYVFIIDEINRGEISKIFGELFYSIDPGYRGTKGQVKTQYAGMIKEANAFDIALGSKNNFGHFFVPENVYIIGTMNDIDRSVESMDFAMRRRFAWKEVKAEESYESIIANNEDFDDTQKQEIKSRMTRLNDEIENMLDREYQIGAAYFLKLKGSSFEALWNNHLQGLLYEYFRGDKDAKDKVEKLHKIYNGTSSDTNSRQQQETVG